MLIRPPFFTNRFEPVAQVNLHLTDKKKVGPFCLAQRGEPSHWRFISKHLSSAQPDDRMEREGVTHASRK